ncbi:DoxX family membrane protein [Candidatus Wolfebacteria bacterium]|nr:DoxX family membrane protein [Candidatus Wolfebacteria bacterium]
MIEGNFQILFLIGRIIYGGYFLMMGLNHFMKNEMLSGYAASKNIPSPKLAVYLSGLFILLGGLGILVGKYTFWSAILIAVFLILVSFKMHNYWKDEDPNAKMMNMTHFLKNLALLGGALMLMSIPEEFWPWPLF